MGGWMDGCVNLSNGRAAFLDEQDEHQREYSETYRANNPTDSMLLCQLIRDDPPSRWSARPRRRRASTK